VTTTLTRRYRFSASHRLHSELLTEAENQTTFGKCNNPYGHGHDYVLEVSVTGELNPATGLIVRLSLLDQLVHDEVLTSFSHRNLNQDVVEFQRLVPTTENVALVIAARIRDRWSTYFTYSSAHLSSISILETDRNSFQVVVPRPQLRASGAPIQENESVIVNA
jgi:6-pyruvoyltetrahydropterin/6-carboxytetrahydropterin synthase